MYSKAELQANVLHASIISKPLCKTKTVIESPFSVLSFIIKMIKNMKNIFNMQCFPFLVHNLKRTERKTLY